MCPAALVLQVGGLQRLYDCGERLTVQASKVNSSSDSQRCALTVPYALRM
jgi:hypothetical protein